MSRNLVRPYFPIPPDLYDQNYFKEVIRSFSIFIQQQQNPGQGRNTFTVFTQLQTDDSGLEIGAVFNHGGYLKVTEANTPHARGSSGTGGVGSVTVTVT